MLKCDACWFGHRTHEELKACYEEQQQTRRKETEDNRDPDKTYRLDAKARRKSRGGSLEQS